MKSFVPVQFDAKRLLENQLFDEQREAYAAMTPAQKTLVHHAYNYGYFCNEEAIRKNAAAIKGDSK